MSKKITDIENWKNDYPFLEEVWSTYKYFDDTNEEGNNKYDVLCSNYILNKIDEESSRYRGSCIRLMKNLRYFSSEADYYKLTKWRCNILFNWMYKLMNEQNITPNIINKCFEVYDDDMKSQKNDNKCHYFRDIKIHEPINITLLDIFDDNISTIKTALMNKDASISTNARNFVCECVNIYKYMNDTYCPKGKEKIEDNLSTCIKLGNFKDSYKLYLYDESDLRTIIPSLDNLDEDLLVKCSDKEEKLQLVSIGLGTPEGYQEHSSTEDFEGAKPYLGMDTTLGNEDSPMRKTITTTIGTFAGASSLLALLYKVNTKFY
ncbi:hypothetical protein PVMG_04598 [Plasmodium vivax Mauritania I]|uniref:Uncharacterized protein n=1 Tax=Plasmodium vivax Mauritania I TaxID=1035515 RepID=A0A0J9VQX2_PLAVI|nr:hypothetical protein PVMG_04598 [Plasmodium vivax Mauritania I]